MKSFIQGGMAAVPTLTVSFSESGVAIQPPSGTVNGSYSRIFITDVTATNGVMHLRNANTVASGSLLAFIAQGNCNFSAPLKVPDYSGVWTSPVGIVGSITYFYE